jgi:hypothetical protein
MTDFSLKKSTSLPRGLEHDIGVIARELIGPVYPLLRTAGALTGFFLSDKLLSGFGVMP